MTQATEQWQVGNYPVGYSEQRNDPAESDEV